MNMTPDRWMKTCDYLDDVFNDADAHLQNLMPRAIEAGVPNIAVSSSVGRLLHMMTKTVGAKTIVEVGTLAGYSGTWMARALPDHGMLITIEPESLHADISQRGFDEDGLTDRVRIVRETGLVAFPKLIEEMGEGSVDLVFLDAIKHEYPDYLPHAKKLLRSGGLLIADNAIGSTEWSVVNPAGSHPNRDGVDRFNRLIADDADFDGCCVPIREGVLMARKR
ncbi:MAG: O-methyltransferase [Phycisphaerales bacterium]|nr:O-methyltransferase [Phycisphaerales bacterium]